MNTTSPPDRYWIAEIPSRATKTVLVRAKSRKDAARKLRSNSAGDIEDIEGIDVEYHSVGYGRIIREDKPARQGQRVNTGALK